MGKRILIVEDELPIAELEKDYLELSGFDVEICSDGTQGLEMATYKDFDMVILDLMLPGTDGIEICKKILEARKDKKCITFSATIKDSEAIGIGEVIHSKKSKAKNKEIIKKFNEATSGVLCTSKAADQGADISGLSVAVIMSTDSSKIRKTQRIGRTIRFEEGKTAELFTLIIKGTQE